MNLVDDDDVAADDDGGYLFLCDIPVFTDHDMELAMRLQQEEDAKTSSTTRGSTHGSTIEDTTFNDLSIQELFVQFDKMYFKASLASVFVEWSKRMTLCAGVCVYQGGGGMCAIRLSEPLLKFRPREDMVNTLLHEMIHAYLFVTVNDRDHDAHGEQFQKLMHQINQRAGTRITIYHNFTDEVDYYRTHWWQCDGPSCRNRSSKGIVKRAMNRPPGPTDYWWNTHQQNCGGTFTKIKEPEEYSKKKRKLEEKKEKKESTAKQAKSFINFFKKGGDKTSKKEEENNEHTQKGGNATSKKEDDRSNKDQKDVIVIDEEDEEDGKVNKRVKRENSADTIRTSTPITSTTSSTTSSTTKSTTNSTNSLNSTKISNPKKTSTSVFDSHTKTSTNQPNNNNNNNKADQKNDDNKSDNHKDNKTNNQKDDKMNQKENKRSDTGGEGEMVACPACSLILPVHQINNHLDLCLQ